MDPKMHLCMIDTSECVNEQPGGRTAGCKFRCPANSCVKHGRSCVDGPEDCECSADLAMESGRCVMKTRAAEQQESLASKDEAWPLESESRNDNVLQRHQEGRNHGFLVSDQQGGPRRLSAHSTSKVIKDLADGPNPQDDMSAAIMDVALLGAQLSICFAFIRCVAYLWQSYTLDFKAMRSWCFAARCRVVRFAAAVKSGLSQVLQEVFSALSSSSVSAQDI